MQRQIGGLLIGKKDVILAQQKGADPLSAVGSLWITLLHLPEQEIILAVHQFARKKAVGKITQKVLTSNLREMEENGIVERKVFPEVPPRVEYTLSDIGYSMAVILDAMAEWGSAYKKLLKLIEKRNKSSS